MDRIVANEFVKRNFVKMFENEDSVVWTEVKDYVKTHLVSSEKTTMWSTNVKIYTYTVYGVRSSTKRKNSYM